MNTPAAILTVASTLAAHEAAVAVANRAVEPITRQINGLIEKHPHEAAQYNAGRYYWPTMDRLRAERSDAWIESALRSGGDPAKLGPRADVDHIARRIFIHG